MIDGACLGLGVQVLGRGQRLSSVRRASHCSTNRRERRQIMGADRYHCFRRIGARRKKSAVAFFLEVEYPHCQDAGGHEIFAQARAAQFLSLRR